MRQVNTEDLRGRVRRVYEQVAREPDGEFHFETGHALAEKLGYPSEALRAIPHAARESFAGVGNPFELAGLEEGETVVDLGSGSGMDVFFAANRVGPQGRVIGIDMTVEQLEKADQLRERHGYGNVTFIQGHVERIPLPDGSVDAVISNGVVNLSADKERVFSEISRVLAPGGRMAIADIVTERQLSENIVCDASLWAACIGGAAQLDTYTNMIEVAGLEIVEVKENRQYEFLSKSARDASEEYGVKSITLMARPRG